jgi:hypothetical protein
MTRFFTFVSLAMFAFCSLSLGQETPKLSIFGNRTSQKGLWKMELLDSSDKSLMANAKAMGSMGICMDAASEMASELSGKGNKDPKEPKCKSKVVKNTSTVAQMEIECPDGQRNSITITAESKDAFVFDMASTKKTGEKMTMKGRYRYAGECKGDSLMQFDKNSPQCAQMAAQMAKMDPNKQCGKLSGDAKANCEQQIKAALGQMAKMCQ